jgi:hypothetical protein
MIDTALGFVLNELNAYLGTSFPGEEKHAVLASVASSNNATPALIDNKIVLSLVNIERETSVGSTGFVAKGGGSYTKTNPSLYVNLYVLMAASYPANYGNALKMLGAGMGFFQARQVFDSQNSANFPSDMTQLSMEIVSLSMAELSTLWAVLGSNYLPSVVYKLRMITVQNAWVIEPIPSVTGVVPTLGN